MNNYVKKRRPYSHEESPAEPVVHDTFSASPGFDSSSSSWPVPEQYILQQAAATPVNIAVPLSRLLDLDLPDNQQYILGQVALALNEPLPFLLDLKHRQHGPNKRRRLDYDAPMPSLHTSDTVGPDDGEKSPSSGLSDQDGSVGHNSSSAFSPGHAPAGWTRARLAECFANFSMCPPCSIYEPSSGYQPLPTTAGGPTTASYSYDAAPSLGGSPVPVQHLPQTEHSYGHGHGHGHMPTPSSFPMEHRSVYPRDDMYACDAPFLSHWYPPLQPSEVTETQPTTSGEGMYYPGNNTWNVGYARPSNEEYEDYDENDDNDGQGDRKNQNDCRDAAFGKQGNPRRMHPTNGQNTTTPSFNDESESLSFQQRHDSIAGNSAPHNSAPSHHQTRNAFQDSEHQAKSSLAPSHQRPLASKRGPFKNHEQRQMTARTRKIGSCVRCRMQRVRCIMDPTDEHGPCLTCKKSADNKIWRGGCLRWKLTSVRLYKPGQVKGLEWTKRWRGSVVDDIATWASSETLTIKVTEGYTGLSVQLSVRQFTPQEGDKLDRTWVSNGVKKSVPIPPFALVDMEAAKASFDNYIKQVLVPCCDVLLGPAEGPLSRTYSLAIRLMLRPTTPAAERRLLKHTLELWMSIRLTTKSFEIVGEETLGMPHSLIHDKDNSLHGKIPLPPVMGAQIDSVLIHQIQPQLRRMTLDELQRMVLENKTKTWLTLYLVIFILLHNTALIIKHDAGYAKKHGMKTRFARQEMVREYDTGANILLAYWHYCNKGTYPFSKSCKEKELASLAELEDDEMQFVRVTRQYASENKEEWQKLWKNKAYEEEYYYVSQLYEQDWLPRLMD